MRPGRLLGLLAIAALCAGLAGLLAPPPAQAAIGIVRWYAVGSDPTATIHYRLNLPANSGTIQIKRASDNSVIKTITLSASELTDGPHSVLWDGTNDAGVSAPTGTYYATITVNRNPVPASPDYGRAIRIRDHSVQSPTSHRYFGIDSDNNPANNNQQNPALSTFGNIYLANTVSKNIEVWLPGNPASADYATCVIGDPEILPGWTTAFAGGSSPFGVAVSRSGRVFSTDRSQIRHANWNWDGSDRRGTTASSAMGNTRDNDVLGLDPAVDGVYHAAVSSGPKFGAVKLGADYTPPNDYGAFKVLATSVAPPDTWSETSAGIGFGDETAPVTNATWYIASAFNGWVKRWTTSGSSWDDIVATQDLGFNLYVSSASDIAISPRNPNIAVVTRALPAAGEHNVEVWDISTQSRLGTFSIGTSPTAKAAFDAWGNALIVAGTASTTGQLGGAWAYLYELPDNGSTDSRDTITFFHTAGATPPVIESAVASPDTIPLDDSTTTTIAITVRDAEGIATLTSVVVDLSPLGYSATTPAVKVSDLSATRAVYEVAGVKAKPSSRAGLLSLAVSATDNSGKTGTGSCALTTTGGTLTGTVRHLTGGFPVAQAAVSATDGKNVYTGTTDSEGVYTLQVNPGTFTVTASKVYYGPGSASSATAVTLGGTSTPATDATVGSININQVRNAPLGSRVCVEAVVCAAGYNPASPANARPKFYLRDASGAANNGLVTPTNNLGIRVYAPAADPAPAEGDRVVVEGIKTLNAFEELRISQVSNYARVATGQSYPAPDAAVANDINDNVNNLSDTRWGNLVKLSGVTVASVTPDATDDWHEMTVTDDSSPNPGLVIVWKATGVTAADLPKAGDIIDVTGVISRKESTVLGGRPNCVEPRRLADLQSAIVDVESVGQAKAQPNGMTVNITKPMVVTLVPLAAPDRYWIQDPDGTAGIRVKADGDRPSVGQTVLVSGRLAVDPANGERMLVNSSFTVAGTGSTKIWTINNRNIGGKGYAGRDGQPVTAGLENQGLLVRVFGQVKKVEFFPDMYFILDDGSQVDSGEVPGIKVIETQAFPSVGDYLSVVGVVSSEIVDGKKVRVLRGREGLFPGDITVLAP
jgi:hypothetical protein